MQPAVIVESHPVHHSLFGLHSGGEFVTMHTGGFQPPPEALGRRVDAPMSSDCSRVGQIGQDKGVQFANDVALQATVNLLFRQVLASAPGDVLQGPRIASHSDHGNGPQGVVGLSLPTAIEPVPTRLSR